jgi:hypothetical protein
MKRHYTVELYKLDRRCKDGRKLVSKMDYYCEDLAVIENDWPVRRGYVRFIHETYVTRRNAMTGVEFQERYDTPWSCSPASETYWSA